MLYANLSHLSISCSITIFTGGVDSLQCLLLDGTSCPKTLCPNSTVIYLCSLPPRISQQGVSRWSLGTIIGNCPNGVIDLRQPIATNDCIVNQTTTCGPYNGSLLIPCAVTTLTVMVTQSLNGTIIQCQNFNDFNYNTEILGSTTIVISGKCTCYTLVNKSKS